MKIIANKSTESKANAVKASIDFMYQKINEIDTSIGLVNTFWKGADSDSFVKKYNEAIIKLREYHSSFEDYYEYLLKIYSIFEAFEETYSKKIDLS